MQLNLRYSIRFSTIGESLYKTDGKYFKEIIFFGFILISFLYFSFWVHSKENKLETFLRFWDLQKYVEKV